jgi:hypothetical protein
VVCSEDSVVEKRGGEAAKANLACDGTLLVLDDENACTQEVEPKHNKSAQQEAVTPRIRDIIIIDKQSKEYKIKLASCW